jgi:hypothetical protein
VSEALRAIGFASLALGVAFGWQAAATARIEPGSPQRLVSEFRLVQFAALLLVLVAGSYIGLAAAHEQHAGTGLDVAFAVGFFVVSATALTRDPREALTILALGFAGHALLDVMHRPGLLPGGIVPRWYLIGCAVYDALIGVLCYLPILRR